MAIVYTHDFELIAGDLEFRGEADMSSGVYSEEQPEELPARLDLDFKQLLELLSKFHKEFGGIEFELIEK